MKNRVDSFIFQHDFWAKIAKDLQDFTSCLQSVIITHYSKEDIMIYYIILAITWLVIFRN